MTEFLPFIILGLTSGSVYGLAGVGLVLTYKTSGVFNFAFGAVGTLAVMAVWIVRWHRISAIAKRGTPTRDGVEAEIVSRLQAGDTSGRKVELVSTTASIEPGIFGIARPMLLWPAAIAGQVSNDHVEAIVMDHPQGTLLTLVNWTNAPAKGLKVSVRLPAAPKSARSVANQKEIKTEYKDGVATFTLDVPEADYVMLMK